MTKYECTKKFAQYLLTIIDGEKSVEYQRQSLGRIPEFEPYAAFQRLDRENKKYISSDDFKFFMKENGIRFSDACLNEFIRQYDRDNDGVLSYEEFLKLVLTTTDGDLRSLVTQRANYQVRALDYLLPEIEESLARLLNMELILVDEMMIKSEGAKYLYGFSIRDMFREIDYFDYGYIVEDELALFLKRRGCFVSNFDLKQLMNRIDRDNDGKVSLREFEALFFLEKKYTSASNFNAGQYSRTFSPVTKSNKHNKRLDDKFSLLSSISRNYGDWSPMKTSLDIRASRNTYTSPLRSERIQKSKFDNNYSSYKSISPRSARIENATMNSNNYSLYQPLSPNRSINFTSLIKSPRIEANNKIMSSSIKEAPLTRSTSRIESNIDYESILAYHFTKLNSILTSIENAKESFALKTDLDIATLFNFFDVFKYGSINIFDFKDGLNNLNIFASIDEVRMLFKTYDLNRDDKHSYNEFTNMISSKKLEYSKLLKEKPKFMESNEESFVKFAELIRYLIESECQIEKLKILSTENPLLVVSSVFDLLKGRIKNYAIIDDVKIYYIII